jgi:hypothetical protein
MPTTTVITLQFLSQRLKLRSLSQRWVVNESLCDNVETWPIATIDGIVTENKQALRSTLGTLGDREVFAEVQSRTNCLLQSTFLQRQFPVNLTHYSSTAVESVSRSLPVCI